MNGEDLFRGLNYVNAKFIDEAENVTQLKGEKKILSVRRTVLIAAIVALMLFLLGCAVVRLISMQVQDTQIYMPDGQTHVGEEVRFEETDDVFIELGGLLSPADSRRLFHDICLRRCTAAETEHLL